jgi:hypothetical protein
MFRKEMSPREANALFALDKLSSDAIVCLANEWIDDGLYTADLGELCTMRSPVMSEVGPLFVSAMKELGVWNANRQEAAGVLLRAGLERLSLRCTDPVKEAEFIYWDIHHEVSNEMPDRKYVGDSLGLEHVFCWLREIWDCRDGSMILYHADLPREKAEKKFIQNLREAAADWLRIHTQ